MFSGGLKKTLTNPVASAGVKRAWNTAPSLPPAALTGTAGKAGSVMKMATSFTKIARSRME